MEDKDWKQTALNIIDREHTKIENAQQFIYKELDKLNKKNLDPEDIKDNFERGYKKALQDVYKILAE